MLISTKIACVLYSLSDDNCNSSSGIVPVNMLSFSVRVSVASQCEFNTSKSRQDASQNASSPSCNSKPNWDGMVPSKLLPFSFSSAAERASK